jgi:xylan 1,4-beta-xylosidase
MARNTLTQRAIGPESIITVEVDAAGMKPGDTAGLALLNRPYAWIGLVKSADDLRLAVYDQTTNETIAEPVAAEHLWLRATCKFDSERADFSWSADGCQFNNVGGVFSMVFQLKTFQGVRYCLFNYATAGAVGGFADFDNFRVVEPRAAGVDRSIPVGKTIMLTSVADGTVLAADEEEKSLRHVDPQSTAATADRIRFKVVDLGQGRVALETMGGSQLMVSDDGTIKLARGEDAVPPATSGESQSLQWINLLRGHTMLMSLANDRYLFAKPNDLGLVTATATGPRPDRRDGACFAWKVVE